MANDGRNKSKVPPGGNELESKEISQARRETADLLIIRKELLEWAVHTVAGTPDAVIVAAMTFEAYLDGSYTPPTTSEGDPADPPETPPVP